MGLNTHNESFISDLSKEVRCRIWWSLYTLYTLLSTITGRPSRAPRDYCTTKIPSPYDESIFQTQPVNDPDGDRRSGLAISRSLVHVSAKASRQPIGSALGGSRSESKPQESISVEDPGSESGSGAVYFLCTVNITILIREAVDNIYAPGLGSKPWPLIEGTIAALDARANRWLHSLPSYYQFQEEVGPGLSRERVSLAFLFFSTKLFICQPCILRFLPVPTHDMIPCRQEAKSNMASVCVQAAMDILRLLPDEPDLHWFYETCPWWCFLHYLMQAVAVCLTAIFISPRSVSDESLCMEAAVSKAMRWLSSISSTNPSSEAALRICTEIIARMRP
ncbi:uncharacterized protein N7469_002280 [Penicillium citrinum]|uniref:Transcription factor domain-containing protein n=1 Tax=Penicillium citrinum TaxID=5077 RepID=A0A9W9PA52_PENCI|nr:uncharacterized protein N7469_002280 [Penicillium citrinum]KAJ5240689.1 hypothetical protein N7469_002280 [Penicillium citrinum]